MPSEEAAALARRWGPVPPTRKSAWLRDRLTATLRAGGLAPGDSLPGSRDLAAALGVSRGTVDEGYAQLVDEGFLIRSARSRPTVAVADADWAPPLPPRSPAAPEPSPGVPDPRLFPHRAWARCGRTALATLGGSDLGYPDPSGHPALRAALAHWLGRTRGVVADADSIHITGGVSHALRLLASVLDAQTWATESPGSDGAVHVLRPTVRCRPVRMDEAGLDPSAVPKGVDAVLVTPTHQYPTGIAMPAERRRALIAGCSAARRWIVEDDYDSHLAVPGIAPAALQALAPESVILTGSVSKMLAPSLRLGWIVAPHRVAERLRTLRGQSDLGVSVPAQLTLAEFITSGDLDRHLRRVRAEYARRRQRLAALLAPRWQLTGAEVGVHAFVATKSPNELIDLLANSRIPAVAITGGRPGVVASVAACR